MRRPNSSHGTARSSLVTAAAAASSTRLVAAIDAYGGEAVALAGDVSDENHAKALVALAVDRFGGLDIAFNNAGARR